MDERTADHGLFFTTLVKTQTNVETRREAKERRAKEEKTDPEFDRLAHRERFRRPPATAVEQQFRHGGWQIERERVAIALNAACVPLSRIERFCDCGSDCIIEYSKQAGRHRTRANYCGDRFCLPCSRARAGRVRDHIEALVGNCLPLLITLTVKNVPGTLTERLNHLLASFRRLRQQVGWKDHINAGAAFVEIKKGAGSGHWHPHLHIVALGTYWPAKELSDGWLQATGDSHRVKIERADNPQAGGAYATKYATKGWTAEVSRDADSLLECVLSLRGRRLCLTFGEWHNADVEDERQPATDWKRVGRLDHIWDRFLAGDAWALAVMTSLGRMPPEAPPPPPAPE